MNTANPIRRALLALLPSKAPQRRSLVLQHLGFEGPDLDTLPAVLDDVGRELGSSCGWTAWWATWCWPSETSSSASRRRSCMPSWKSGRC
jgi:hypothetical protein